MEKRRIRGEKKSHPNKKGSPQVIRGKKTNNKQRSVGRKGGGKPQASQEKESPIREGFCWERKDIRAVKTEKRTSRTMELKKNQNDPKRGGLSYRGRLRRGRFKNPFGALWRRGK